MPFISRILRLCTNNAEVETPSEIEFQQETEIENPAEIGITTLQAVKEIWAPLDQEPLKYPQKNQIHLSHFRFRVVKKYR